MFFQRDARRMIRLLLVAVPAFPTHLRLGDIRTLRHFDFRGAVPRGFRRLGPQPWTISAMTRLCMREWRIHWRRANRWRRK